jgi:hypothetical protein
MLQSGFPQPRRGVRLAANIAVRTGRGAPPPKDRQASSGGTMSSSEQREHTRYPKKLAVDVHVVVMPRSQSQEGFEAQGRTIDIGRGGVLMKLDKEVPEGVQVRLRFWELPPGVRLWPLMMSGTIVRLEPGEGETRRNMIGAGSLLAIEFTEPFDELEVPA